MNMWGIEWHSVSKLGGERRHLMWAGTANPHLFPTKREAKAFIDKKYGYILKRPDLRQEPHGWRIPKAIKVKLVRVSDD